MHKPILGLALFVATAAAVVLYPAIETRAVGQPQPPVEPAQLATPATPPRIDVVFALDTTGSMSGLIHAAKEKIWSIATNMAQTDPAPAIRMGLVAYRDRGDAYVTRVTDLSGDLDSIYAELMQLSAQGGGDGPESVNRALADAVEQMSWSDDDNAYRVVFLVGDAPPHMDYADERRYPEIARLARARGIVINTIRCGNNEATRAAWQQIASLTEGDFFNVGQDGSAVAVSSPFDARIAALSRELDDTRLVFGDAEDRAAHAARQAATERLHAEASAASRARRAAFNVSAAGKRNLLGDKDLVDAVTSGRVDVAEVAAEALPAPVAALPVAEREAFVREQANKRKALEAEIATLAASRDDYIEEKLAAEGGAAASLDVQLYESVQRQGAARGLEYAPDARF
ncbi:MAG: vWA domain-containing protein [Gammaproteobacteria bacterium]